MNILSFLLGIKKAWDSMPASERTAIVDVLEEIGSLVTSHRTNMAAASGMKPPAETANQADPK